MKPAPFRLHRPTTLGEAITLLAELGDDAKVLSGGQSLVPVLALRLSRFGHLIDLNGVTELDGVRTEGTDLVVGGLTRHAALTTERSTAGIAQPLLPLAARLIGHPAIRNRGTHGGSIAHADPAAELPAAAVAVGATIEVTGPGGTRFVAASDFFVATWETALQGDEIVTAVRWPAWSGTCGWSVRELARRHGDFAVAGAVCGVSVADGLVERAAVVLLGMAPVPARMRSLEEALVGQPVERLLAGVDRATVAASVAADACPSSDLHGSADYRRAVAARMAADAVTEAVGRAAGTTPARAVA